jgi:hypothetical protein
VTITAARRDLAARLATATGLPVEDHPPPAVTPPMGVVMIGPNYLAGPRHTGCLVDMQVVVRLVSDVQESSGLYDDLDTLVESALAVLPGFTAVTILSRTYGDKRYLCADITVTTTATLDLPTAIPAVPSPRPNGRATA